MDAGTSYCPGIKPGAIIIGNALDEELTKASAITGPLEVASAEAAGTLAEETTMRGAAERLASRTFPVASTQTPRTESHVYPAGAGPRGLGTGAGGAGCCSTAE